MQLHAFATWCYGNVLNHERMAKMMLLAVCTFPLGQCASNARQEFVTMPFLIPDEMERTGKWEFGHQAETGLQRVTEYVRPGQTVEDWEELVTIESFDKLVDWGSIDSMLQELRDNLAKRCPGSTLDVIHREVDSVIYETSITNCPEFPDEKSVGRVLDGRRNRFVIIYATRAPVLTAEKRTDWINLLSKTRIVVLGQ